LRIQPYWSEGELELPVDRLSHWLRPGPMAESLKSFLVLELKSGDQLTVRDLWSQEGELAVVTAWQQTLRVPLDEVHAIRFYEKDRLWIQARATEDLFPTLGGKIQLHTGGPVFETLPMTYPESFMLEMELEVPSENFQIQLQLFNDEDRQNLGRLVLELSDRQISAAWFRRVEAQGFRVDSWQAEPPGELPRYQLRLFVDMERNEYALFLNEHLIQRWEVQHLGTLLRGSASPMQLRVTSGNEPVWLRSLRVLHWIGEPVPPATMDRTNRAETVMVLIGGKRLEGRLDEIGSDTIRFQTLGDSAAVSYDRADIHELVLPESAPASDPAKGGHLRLFTNRAGDRLSVESLALDEQHILARVRWTDTVLNLRPKDLQIIDFQPGVMNRRTVTGLDAAPHQLRLLNGDRIPGTYAGQDGEELLFRTDWQPEPLRILGRYVDQLQFGMRDRPAGEGWDVFFRNGDVISSSLLKKTDDKLLVTTKWSEGIQVEMPQVAAVRRRLPAEQILERGPTSMDHWVFSNRREVELTETERNFLAAPEGWWLSHRGMVQKHLPKVQESFGFSTKISPSPEQDLRGGAGIVITALPDEKAGYRIIQLSQRGDRWLLNLTDTRREGSRNLALPSVLPDAQGDILFQFEFHQPSKRLQIHANGEKIYDEKLADWSFTSEAYTPMITFSVNGASSRLLIREWRLYLLKSGFHVQSDSVFRDFPSRVWLANGDQMETEWVGTNAEGDWLLKPSGGGDSFPLAPDRIQSFITSLDGAENAKRKASHIRLTLNGAAEVFTAELLSADDEAFRIRREGWAGTQRVPVDQVEKIDFNPYRSVQGRELYPESTRWLPYFQ
jgi:hypothetical protein